MPTRIEWTDDNANIDLLKPRFWTYVKKGSEVNDCWEWQGAKARGYGLFRVHLKCVKAHRIAWYFSYGLIPSGLCVLHHCDNKLCVRPGHLFLGSVADNNRDMRTKGRQVIVVGENNGATKLTREQVMKIRNQYGNVRITHAQLAKEYGVARQTISAVLHRANWGWLA